MLRLSVDGGGCSGYQYAFSIDDRCNEGDRVFSRDGADLIVDSISLPYVRGATVDFTEELIRSSFTVVANPNSTSSCSCGVSFASK
eukprot:SM000026S08916  [mRNA]  locus=s26:426593:427155:- [translate_table: standard]